MGRHAVALLLLFIASARPALAQRTPLPPVDTARVVELRLSDGTIATGKVLAVDTLSLTLTTPAGARLLVPLASLASWRPLDEKSPPGFTRDPSDSRLFLGHTARPMPKGRGYVLDYLIFFPVASYGVTDRFTLTGGMSLIPFLPDQLFYVAPKYTLVDTRGASLAAGVLYLRLVGFLANSGYAGIAYGVTTLGNGDHAATVLVGWPFAQGGWSREAMVVLGGESRVSERVKLLGEAWKIPGTSIVPAVGGVRLIGASVSLDLGLFFLLGQRETRLGFLPWVDVSIRL